MKWLCLMTIFLSGCATVPLDRVCDHVAALDAAVAELPPDERDKMSRSVLFLFDLCFRDPSVS